MRTLTSDLKKHTGKSATIQGWLHKKRNLGALMFVVLRDRDGLAQVVIKDEGEQEKLRGLQIGTVLEITGHVKDEPRATGGVEVHDPKITVLVPVTDEPPIEIDKPLSHRPDNLDTLFDNRAIGLRNLQEAAVFRVQAKVLTAFRSFFAENDFIEINSPKLLAEATEGGAETFKVEHFGKTATLAQSAQFYKQIMVGVFERVYEINPTYRAEPSATTRHMTEYITVDAEIGFIDFPDLLNLAAECLISITDTIKKEASAELGLWKAESIVLPKSAAEIPRLTITEIHRMFKEATREDHSSEDDLAPVEERWICRWAKEHKKSEAVLVTGWSATSKTFKFYHRTSAADPKIADRADLLFRGVEIATLSMRENRYEQLVAQLKAAGGNPEAPGYSALLSVYQHGMPPHGGWGWGLERTVAKIVGLDSVKEASLFPRDMNRLAP